MARMRSDLDRKRAFIWLSGNDEQEHDAHRHRDQARQQEDDLPWRDERSRGAPLLWQ